MMSHEFRVAVWGGVVLAAMLAVAPARAGQDRGGGAAARPGDDPAYPPLCDGQPVEVTVGLYVLDFARLTAREESFDLTGYLELSWRDPRLVSAAVGKPMPGGVRRVEAGRIWAPRVFFHNALEPPRFHDSPVVGVDANGVVTSWAIVSGKFSAPLDLRRFPSDSQVLPVRVGAFDDTSVVRFAANRDLVLVTEGAFVSDWTVDRPSARVSSFRYVPGQEAYSLYHYEVTVRRRATFFVWRVLVPLTLLALVAGAAVWFEPTNLQPQISTCMAALISLVAFDFAVDFAMPKVAYLNLTDMHAMIGFWFVAASVVAVAVIHQAVVTDRLPRARAIQRVCRWLFPLAYAAAVGLNALVAFRGGPPPAGARRAQASAPAGIAPPRVVR